MKKIKILHLFSGYGGGISSHINNIVKNISTDKIIIDVISFTEYPSDFVKTITSKSGKLYTMPRFKGKNILISIKFLRKVLKSNEYEFIHSHITGYRALILKFLTIRYSKKKFIVHAHSTASENKSKYGNIFSKFDKKINSFVGNFKIACSLNVAKNNFIKKDYSKNNIFILKNGVDYDQLIIQKNEENIRKKYNISSKTMVIGHIGRFSKVKNHIFMLDIIKGLNKKNLDFKWLFVGSGDLFEKIKTEIIRLGIEDKVILVGRAKNVAKYYSAMDIFYLPSSFEGFPTVVIEAQTLGINCIISDNITEEVDLRVNLIDRLNLSNTIDENINLIIKVFQNKSIPTNESVKTALKERNLLSSSMGKSYYENLLKFRGEKK